MSSLRFYSVDVIIDTLQDAMPRWYASRTDDGRWRFTEIMQSSSAEQCIEYLKHYIHTPPAPLTLELVVTGEAELRHGPWSARTGPRFTSGYESSPHFQLHERAVARFKESP